MRRRRSLQWIIVIGLFILELILVIALLTAMASEASAQTDHIRLQSLDGGTARLTEHRGQVVALTSNASWTPMINEFLPALQRIANIYRSRGAVFYWASVNSVRAGERVASGGAARP